MWRRVARCRRRGWPPMRRSTTRSPRAWSARPRRGGSTIRWARSPRRRSESPSDAPMIDFELSDEQNLVRTTARDFAECELAPKAAACDRPGEIFVAEMRALAKLGLLGVNIPESLGGAEAGVVSYSLAMTEIARADASVSVAMAVTNMVGEVIVRFGTDAQKQALVPVLTSGDALVGAFGLSEPQA